MREHIQHHQKQNQRNRNKGQNNGNQPPKTRFTHLKELCFYCTHGNIDNECQPCSYGKGCKYGFEEIEHQFNPIRIKQQPVQQNTSYNDQKNITQSGAFEISYLFGEKNNEGNIFRWDPIERGIIALKDVSVKIVYEDETIDNLTQDKLSHNGRNMNEYILFAQDDPQMILETDKKKKVKKIVFGGVAQENIPPEFYENPQKGKRAQIKDELCKIIDIIKR